jgi:drug/metabolite transporter (DMT)-like permease
VLVTSFLGLTLAALAAAAGALSIIPQLAFVPTLAQMKHLPTLLLGCGVGGAILTLMFYFNFSAVVKITTENLTAMMAFSPITAWVFQEIGVSLGLIAAQRPEPRLVAAMAVMIASVLVMFWAGRRRASQAVTPLP